MVLEQLNVHMEKNSNLTLCTKINMYVLQTKYKREGD